MSRTIGGSAARLAIAGLAATTWVAVSPLRFAYESLPLRLVMDTAQACIAFLSALLVYGAFRRTRQRADLLVAYGLMVLGLTNLSFSFAASLPPDFREAAGVWGPVAAGIVATGALALAAVGPDSQSSPRWSGLRLSVAASVSVAWIIAVTLSTNDRLPIGLQRLDAAQSTRPDLLAHSALIAGHGLLFVLSAVGAVGFSRRHQLATHRDSLVGALAIGSVFAALARANYALYPSLYTHIVHVGDAFRFAFYVALLVGATRRIRALWASEAAAATEDTRRKVARDVHDGLTQELAFVASQTSSLASGRGDLATLESVALAADRAVAESRRLIEMLDDDVHEPLEFSLRRAAGDVALREGRRFELSVPADLVVRADRRHQLGQIVREATVNAVRHGAANCVTVSVERADRDLVISVVDDGSGFPADQPAGFGLRSIAARAAGLGGTVEITSSPGDGTRILVKVPTDA